MSRNRLAATALVCLLPVFSVATYGEGEPIPTSVEADVSSSRPNIVLVLADDAAPRGGKTNRDEVGEFEVYAPSVIVTSGGIGGNFEMVRKNWVRYKGMSREKAQDIFLKYFE